MPRVCSYCWGILIAVLLVGGPLAYTYYQQSQIRHFRVVRDGILYRSGQMSLAGLQRVVHDFGIRTVVTLRDAHYQGDPPPDLAEEEYCRAHDLNYYRITPRTWWPEAGFVPAEQGVRVFREVMDDPKNYPVLIHCFAGIHRTGAYCAVYRMEFEHWSNAEAIAEMKGCGYVNVYDELDVLSYLERYRPRWAKPAPQVEPAPDVQTAPRPKRPKKRPPRVTQWK